MPACGIDLILPDSGKQRCGALADESRQRSHSHHRIPQQVAIAIEDCGGVTSGLALGELRSMSPESAYSVDVDTPMSV